MSLSFSYNPSLKIFNPNFSYKSVTICVGEGELIKGLDTKLVGKDKGSFKIELDVIWDIIKDDLPELKKQIKEILTKRG